MTTPTTNAEYRLMADDEQAEFLRGLVAGAIGNYVDTDWCEGALDAALEWIKEFKSPAENNQQENTRRLQGALRNRNEQIARLKAELERIKTRTPDEALADVWDEGERHESSYMDTWGQFCPSSNCNPYRERR